MNQTLGMRIAALRKQKNLTQEGLAELLGVSPQAVSKWENDQSCPDILLLPKLAKVLGTSTDCLLSGEPEPEVKVVPVEKRKKLDEMMLRIYINEDSREQVRISVPLTLLKIALESGMQPQFTMTKKGDSAPFFGTEGRGAEALRGIDFAQIFKMVESGLIGTLMEIDTGDGTAIRIVVE